MALTFFEQIIILLLLVLIIGGFITLVVLLIRTMLKYLRGGNQANTAQQTATAPTAATVQQAVVLQSLGEALKSARISRKLTQEYVADTLGVSRQAVSKWENGTSDPSTSNLIALAKLYDCSVEQLLAGLL